MIQIKRCNYITGGPSDVSYAVKKIVNFLEMEGRNTFLFCKSKSSNSKGTTLKYLMEPKIEFNNLEHFTELINNKSNLFRVDLLLFDFWHLNVSSIIEYKEIIDKLNIDYIILAKEYHYKSSEDVSDYHVKIESSELYNNEYLITDKISGWTSNLESISKSYIRNKKIDDILNKNDE
jgi:hypothetical protein